MASQHPVLIIIDDDPLITDTLHYVLGKDFDVFVAASSCIKTSRIEGTSKAFSHPIPQSRCRGDVGLN